MTVECMSALRAKCIECCLDRRARHKKVSYSLLVDAHVTLILSPVPQPVALVEHTPNLGALGKCVSTWKTMYRLSER